MNILANLINFSMTNKEEIGYEKDDDDKAIIKSEFFHELDIIDCIS